MLPSKYFRRIVGVLGIVLALSCSGSNAFAALFISEYIEGTSNNKALEFYNPTGSAIDLSGYAVKIYYNGASIPNAVISLTGTILSKDVFVLSNPSAAAGILAQTDLTSGSLTFNGNDAVELVQGSTTLDVIGQIGYNPGTDMGWGIIPTITVNATLRRKGTILTGDANGSDAFDPSVEWNGYAVDTFNNLGTHSVVPVPPTVYLFGSGLASLAGLARFRKKRPGK